MRLLGVLLGAAASLALLSLALFVWGRAPGAQRSGEAQRVVVEVQAGENIAALAPRLAELGLHSQPRLLTLYAAVFARAATPRAGRHFLSPGLSTRELLRQLSRSSGRSAVRVLIPEGHNHVQIAERLEREGICPAQDFVRAARSAELASRLGITSEATSAAALEGYLFPATYDLHLNSAPESVLEILVRQGQRRLERLQQQHASDFARRASEHGLRLHGVLTLASMVEKEAAHPDEKPLIASVFLNRLRDSNFRPLRMLQSDPTASFGCLVLEPAPPSCSAGRPTPAMLRDGSNPYNTYRHAGLPPGPIASPGEAAILAVLRPAPTDYLYFVGEGGGRHKFSRTFAEHRSAIERQK
jgi:UPF0755 protein